MLEPFDQPLASGFGDSADFMDRMGSRRSMRFLSGLGSRVSPNNSDTEFVEEVPWPLSV